MNAPKQTDWILAGDIGGTNTRLGLFREGTERPEPNEIAIFSSKDAPSLEHIIGKFLKGRSVSVDRACFGVAGPVVAGESNITNLSWHISRERVKKVFGFASVRLVNDLSATALAVPVLKADELFALNPSEVPKNQNLALIAPGTGLGEAIIVHQNGRYTPISSEGGHADFAPINADQMKLWHYLHRQYGHVSVERVISGSGLVNIYNWFKDTGKLVEPAWLSQRLAKMDPARAISEGAMVEGDPGCVEVLNMFVSILGAAAGNLALTAMTTGGVYLGGGIPPKILPQLKEDIFMQAFRDKGRFKRLLEKIPIWVILNDKAALLGAAQCAIMATSRMGF